MHHLIAVSKALGFRAEKTDCGLEIETESYLHRLVIVNRWRDCDCVGCLQANALLDDLRLQVRNGRFSKKEVKR